MSQNWKEWFEQQVAASTMRVEQVALGEANGWGMQEGGARFGRPDGAFFSLVGAKVTTGRDEREVRTWSQPLLKETGVGVVVLAYRPTVFHGEPELLLRARVEPGNEKPGRVLLGPTLQASESNLQQAHGGNAPPRAELFPRVSDESWWVELPMDGGRFLGKNNRGALLEVQDLVPDGAEFWFSRSDLKDAVLFGLLNEHLLQLLGIGLIQGLFNPHGV